MTTTTPAHPGMQELLVDWQRGLHIFARSHFCASKRYTRNNDILGVSVIVASAIVSSAIIANLGASDHIKQLAIGIISLVATILAATQKFLAYSETAAKHHEAAKHFEALRDEVEMLLAKLIDSEPITNEQIDSIRKRKGQYEEIAPTIPDKIYQKEHDAVLQCEKCPQIKLTVAHAN